MNDSQTTIIGNLVKDPVIRTVGQGVPVATFRVASTPRRWDRATDQWRDGTTLYVSVTCWRRMAENAAAALRRGDPVVVAGRLTMRSYEKDGQIRDVYEVEASVIAPDLSRVAVALQRTSRAEVHPFDSSLTSRSLDDPVPAVPAA